MVSTESANLNKKCHGLQPNAEGRVFSNAKQIIWQSAIFMIGMATLVFAILNYQTSVIERRFEDLNNQIGAEETNLNGRLDAIERRMDRIEKNFDDLNKELRLQRK